MQALRKIKTKKDYQTALQRFETIFAAKEGTPESDEADVLSLLIKEYEDLHFVIKVPDPISAIRYRMEQQGLSNSDLAQVLGYKSGVNDILKKHRKLSLNMIRRLNEQLHIPLETLVKEY
ncbi:MAG: transcriptional regulator [Bacteroidetes bacterium]|nr:MAG: transcriptional regulator [Bacteroidota bacterium]